MKTINHPWYIEDDNGIAGLHYMNTGEAVAFDRKDEAQAYIDRYLDSGIYNVTDILPERFGEDEKEYLGAASACRS